MKRVIIRPETCTGCSDCAVQQVCDRDAVIRESPEDKPWIDFYKCSGCMKCVIPCPSGAVEEVSQPCSGRARSSW